MRHVLQKIKHAVLQNSRKIIDLPEYKTQLITIEDMMKNESLSVDTLKSIFTQYIKHNKYTQLNSLIWIVKRIDIDFAIETFYNYYMEEMEIYVPHLSRILCVFKFFVKSAKKSRVLYELFSLWMFEKMPSDLEVNVILVCLSELCNINQQYAELTVKRIFIMISKQKGNLFVHTVLFVMLKKLKAYAKSGVFCIIKYKTCENHLILKEFIIFLNLPEIFAQIVADMDFFEIVFGFLFELSKKYWDFEQKTNASIMLYTFFTKNTENFKICLENYNFMSKTKGI